MTQRESQDGMRERIAKGSSFETVESPPFPADMLIEITNTCNHACMFCANRGMTRHRRVIDEALLRRILEEGMEAGVTDVGLYSTGEPFILADFPKYVSWTKELGYEYTYISTNGALATPERAASAMDAGLDSVKFSINAGTRETYAQIHGRDDFDRVIANLRFMSEYRREKGLPLRLYVTYVVTKENVHEQDTLREAIGPLVDDMFFFDVANQGGMMPEAVEHSARDTRHHKPLCRLPFNQLNVTVEGYLTICCVDYQNFLVVADLNEMSLTDAWESPAFKEIRRRHLAHDLRDTLCGVCREDGTAVALPLAPAYATPWHQGTGRDGEAAMPGEGGAGADDPR